MSPAASSGDRPASRAVLASRFSTYLKYAYGARRYVRSDLADAYRNLLARS